LKLPFVPETPAATAAPVATEDPAFEPLEAAFPLVCAPVLATFVVWLVIYACLIAFRHETISQPNKHLQLTQPLLRLFGTIEAEKHLKGVY
jgi:hypothetical protein